MARRRCAACLLWVLLLLPAAAGTSGAGTLQLTYEGAFAPPHHRPPGPRYGYGLKGMSYSAECAGAPDPSPGDGYPGCLIATSHGAFDRAGLFDIPVPERVARDKRTESFYRRSLSRATTVIGFFDPSGGLKEALDQQPGWKARDIPGVLLLGNELLSTCGHDWYNAGRLDHASHCWARLRPDGGVVDALGPFNLGPQEDPEAEFHADKMSHYLGVVGQRFADEQLAAGGRRLCFSGMQRRGGGGRGRSQGPTIFLHDCSRPRVAPPGPLQATRLLAYRPRQPLGTGKSDFPDYSPADECFDAVWIERGEAHGVLFACQQGGPFWWYGFADPWREPNPGGPLINHRNLCFWNRGRPKRADGSSCVEEFSRFGPPLPCYGRSKDGDCVRGLTDRCGGGKGFHGVFEQDPQVRARLLWYPAEGLAEVLRQERDPWQAPFESMLSQPEELWPTCRGAFGGLAYDAARGRLYVAQIHRGELPVIHVYSLDSGASP